MLTLRAWHGSRSRAFSSGLQKSRSPSFRRICRRLSSHAQIQKDETPAEVQSITESELKATPDGGASTLSPGEMGASEADMRQFWRHFVASVELSDRLAEKASLGGIWGDPQTLVPRCREIETMIPVASLSSLLGKCPALLEFRSQHLRSKLLAISEGLPDVDIVSMVARMPRCFFCQHVALAILSP